MDFENLDNTMRKFEKIANFKEGKKTVQKANTAGANILKKEAKRLAPKKTGLLRRSITSRQVDKKWLQPYAFAKYVTIKQKKCFYGAWIDTGFIRNGKFYSGKHFMQKAFQTKKSEAKKEGTIKLLAEIKNLFKKK